MPRLFTVSLVTVVLALGWVNATQASGLDAKNLAALGLTAEPQPVAARYDVTITRGPADRVKTPASRHTWYFYRDAQQIALLKGTVDEVWYRDAGQRVSFERVFHDDARVVDYSAGELATLHVDVNWNALSTLVDPMAWSQLKVVSTQGKGRETRLQLRGRVGASRVEVDWVPALQLPQRFTRHEPGGTTVQMVLKASASTAPSDWPQPGARSGDYLHLDAADFGDMDSEPVVRKSEALDTRLGWRANHSHD